MPRRYQMSSELKEKRHDLIKEISKISLKLARKKLPVVAADLAKIAIDLTNGSGLVKVSPNGVSIGDRVRSTIPIKRRDVIQKNTQGNVVGFEPNSGRYLVLFFPVWFPQGVLALVEPKNIVFLTKPKISEETEQEWTDPQKSPEAPRSAVVEVFINEALAKVGLSVAGNWMYTRGEDSSTWNLRGVIRRHGAKIPRGNKLAAKEIIGEIVTSLKQQAIPEVMKCGLDSYVKIKSASAWEAEITHKEISSYAALEIVYQV